MVNTATEVLRDVIDVNKPEPFSKFKLLKPEFAFFFNTDCLSGVCRFDTDIYAYGLCITSGLGCFGSGAPNTIWKAESLQIFNVILLVREKDKNYS